MAVENHDRKAATEAKKGHTEQETMISLNRIAQPSHVAENRGHHGAGGQNAAHPAQSRDQKANRCEPSIEQR